MGKTASFIPLQKASLRPREEEALLSAFRTQDLAGGGLYTKACDAWLEANLQAHALTVTSGTGALEIACLLAGLQPGDEVIMPSFTFPSTANAVVLRGGVPVFVDIRPDTLNLDETKLDAAITRRTRAIAVVHYAGVSCAMEPLQALARQHKVCLIEDAAHGFGASYKGQALGTMGDMGTLSFHATKNITAGQGGAFITRHKDLFHRAQIITEKGTDRAAFFRDEVQKYCWQDVGGNYRPSELQTALLAQQLERGAAMNAARLDLWQRYQDAFAGLETEGFLTRPVVPEGCTHNAHLYFIRLESEAIRGRVLHALREENITAAFHYVPLHLAPAGQRYGRAQGVLDVTVDQAARLLRLPLFADLSKPDQDRVIEAVDRLVRRETRVARKVA